MPGKDNLKSYPKGQRAQNGVYAQMCVSGIVLLTYPGEATVFSAFLCYYFRDTSILENFISVCATAGLRLMPGYATVTVHVLPGIL